MKQWCRKLFEQTPQLATRCREFSADRELDSGRLKTTLWDTYRIRPIIASDRCGGKKGTAWLRFTKLECEDWQQCLANAGSYALSYGRTVRVKLDEQNRRIFTPTPRATLSWRRSYNLRSAMERNFNRFAQGYRFERHYIRGHAKMKARATLAAAVLMVMALGQVRNGRQQQMRSLVRPIAVLDTGWLPTIRLLPFKPSALRTTLV